MGATHQPCPVCGSSDALQINDNGSTYCHSCNTYTPVKNTKKLPENYIKGKFSNISSRCLLKDTCKKYSYTITEHNGRKAHIANYRNLKGEIKWQKIRYVDSKEFFINKLSGKSAEPLLYGMHLFAGNKKKLTITEGEIDCLSVSQIFDNKYAIVSLPMGASSAEKAIRHNIEFINQFEEIILMFDNDEAGKEAVARAAELLAVGKVKIATLPLKDSNEMLQADRAKEVIDAFYNAKDYRPDGIVYGNELWEEVKKPVEYGYPYPFQTLTEHTYGLRIPEYILIGAGTGIGKTTFITELEKYFSVNCNLKVGILHLEQTIKETCLYIMSNYAELPLFRPDIKISEEDKKEYFEGAINNGNIFFYKAFGTKDFEIIKNIIRYLVIKQGCQIIFLDHISALASGIKAGNDINQIMKNISSELASLTKELNFTLIAVSHLRKSTGKKSWENGGMPTLDDFEGSSDIVKWANFVYTLSRDKNAQGEAKNILKIHCLKDRYTGKADGLIIPIKYNTETCTLTELTNAEEFINDTENGDSGNQEEQEEF